MILNEKKLFDAVTEKFGIENGDCGFSVKVLTLCCLQECGSFVKDDTYTLWFGNLLVNGVRKYFACRFDGKVEEVSAEAFKILNEPKEFIYPDNHLYAVIYNSAGVCQVIPYWRLDLIKVKKNARFSAKYGRIIGKLEHIGIGNENFFAWVFYAGGELLKIFNIESGEWLGVEKAIEHLTLGDQQLLPNVGFDYEHDFVPHSRIVDVKA